MLGLAPLKTHPFLCFQISQTAREMSVLSPFYIPLGTLIAWYHQLENLLVETRPMELNPNQSLKNNKLDLSSKDARDQQMLDGPLLPDCKEDRPLDEGVLSLLGDHQSSICC